MEETSRMREDFTVNIGGNRIIFYITYGFQRIIESSNKSVWEAKISTRLMIGRELMPIGEGIEQ